MTAVDSRKPRPAFFLALALVIFWCPRAHAKSVALDDTGTEALEPQVFMYWKNAVPSRSGNGDLMVGSATFRVRINVMPWVRHSARIYLVLPAQPPGPISASWRAQGRLLSGQVNSGNRVLVYSGAITSPFLEDVLEFHFSVDSRLMRRAFPVDFHFELDES